jgi:hypothetical protein
VDARRTELESEALTDAWSNDRDAHALLAVQLQRELFSKFPLFFRSVQYPVAYPSNLALMGIRCGPGWFSVVDEAARDIEQELDEEWCRQLNMPHNIASLDYEMRWPISPRYTSAYPVMHFCSDIREASGQLEILVVGGYLCNPAVSRRIDEVIQKAQMNARTICECCGAPGTFRQGQWQHVYCEECIAPKLMPDSFDRKVVTSDL